MFPTFAHVPGLSRIACKQCGMHGRDMVETRWRRAVLFSYAMVGILSPGLVLSPSADYLKERVYNTSILSQL